MISVDVIDHFYQKARQIPWWEEQELNRGCVLQMGACTREKEWYYFITVALVTYFGGLFILIPCRCLWYYFHQKDKYGYVCGKNLRAEDYILQCSSSEFLKIF